MLSYMYHIATPKFGDTLNANPILRKEKHCVAHQEVLQ